ncbi:type II toxin-antitoxin system YafO family toxin [Shewanella fodinae]|jgi:hypothetical protein|uniref:Type II toxin-antitoxin system toxin YafO n=1 Tax=Shewanella fodinae TaxID=552357 RepID=A0A4R2F2T6_9GAMM|nr:mRNA interferase YafO [Shewanella sp.]TCN77721.1 type II toxin-antitoxin system toxin YafO [Shewanella fodinae]
MDRSIRVLTTANPVWKTPLGTEIVAHFKNYKARGITPLIFGRDAPLKRPKDAEFAALHHLHIGNFNAITRQYSRTSDTWLIYSVGFLKQNCFLLIDILSPDAHKDAERYAVMQPYIDTANRFREEC